MKATEVTESFIHGAEEGNASNILINKNRLINYATCIAYRRNDGVILLNGQKYSSTTSKHQNIIRRSGVEYIEYMEYETEEDFNKAVKLAEKSESNSISWRDVLDTKIPGSRYRDIIKSAKDLGYEYVAFNGNVYEIKDPSMSKPVCNVEELI